MILTKHQIQTPIDVDPLLNTVTDYLHFVTEFFDVISQSGPHIYHSALLLAPLSSVVRNQYSHQISSPVSKIVTGIPISWDSCIASAGGIAKSSHAAWSPCGQFVAASFGDTIQIRDSNTLERVSVFSLPSNSVQCPDVFLAFSPDGCLLACNYLECIPFNPYTPSWLPRYPAESGSTFPWKVAKPKLKGLPLPAPIYIWDVQTGTTIYSVKNWELDKFVFSGNYQTVTLLGKDGTFRTYDGLNGTCIHKDKLVSPPNFVLDAYWIYKESLLFPTISKKDEKLVVNIQELQPTLTPPLSLIVTFLVPPHSGEFSFSPVSLHGSFTTKTEVIVLNIQDSKILLQVRPPSSLYTPPGHFSFDGCFFACGTEEFEICIWKNTSVNYMPWCNLWPRLPFNGFSFSPTKSSILTWGETGIQLLEPSDHLAIISPKKPKHYQWCKNHLVAYSANGTHIAIAQKEDSVITFLDAYLNTPNQLFNTNMPILDIKIVNNTIFVAGKDMLVKWHLEMGRIVYGSHSIVMATGLPNATLSGDCLYIAFVDPDEVILYNIQAQRILCRYQPDDYPSDPRFSPDGHKLWLTCEDIYCAFSSPYLVEFEIGEDGNVTIKDLGDTWSWVNIFSHGWEVRCGSEWVVDSRGNKLLWLPLSWRPKQHECIRWDGNFLALVDSHHPEPIIIEFQH